MFFHYLPTHYLITNFTICWFFLLSLLIVSINASVTSSTEMTKSKTVIQMEKEKIYLFLHQFVKKVSRPSLNVVDLSALDSIGWACDFVIDSNYNRLKSYGNGERPRNRTNGWKGSPFQRITLTFYWGKYYSHLLFTLGLVYGLFVLMLVFEWNFQVNITLNLEAAD